MKEIIATFFIVLFLSCNSKNEKPAILEKTAVKTDEVKPITPAWVLQQIDNVNSCDIIMPDAVKIIKVGSRFTAYYSSITSTGGFIENYMMVDKRKEGIHFAPSSLHLKTKFFDDSCDVKESLRDFTIIKITAYIVDNGK